MYPSYLRICLFVVLLALISACSNTSRKDSSATNPYDFHNRQANIPHKDKPVAATTYSGVFPKPAAIVPAVEFWRKTYAIWSRSQVAFHDDKYMDVIYEVMELPGNVGEGLTNEQKDMVNQRRDYWRGVLAGLAMKIKYAAELNANEQQILAKIQSAGHSMSIINGASDRLRSQRGTRERFKRGLEISGRYDQHFKRIFQRAGLPEDLAFLPHVESSFQVSAKSSAGAVGLWQFTKPAAKTFMPNGDDSVETRMDPFISANAAARYLSHAYSKLSDWALAVTSYNHGIGGMKRAQTQMGNDFARIVEQYDGPAFGFASRNYYAQFFAAREIALEPKVYYKEGINYESPVEFLAKE